MNRNVITYELIEKFKTMLRNDEKSDNTIEKYMRDVKKFLGFAKDRDIDKLLILEYKMLLEQKYALNSANSMIASLNCFLQFLGLNELCVKQFKIQKKTYCSKESELTKSEYFLLINTAEKNGKERLAMLIQTICSTGIRISELEYITVEAVKKKEAIVNCKNKSRKVFLIPKLCKKLKNYANKHNIKSGAIFITRNGKKMNRSNIWREMKLLCKTAGVLADKVFPHNLRHLFARTFYSIDKDIAKLADILGHSNINTTRIYIISTGEEHRKKLQNLKLII